MNNKIDDNDEDQKLLQEINNVEHFLTKLKIRLEGKRLRMLEEKDETTISQ